MSINLQKTEKEESIAVIMTHSKYAISFEDKIAGHNNNNYNNANECNYTSKVKSLCLLRHTLQFESLQLHRKQRCI